MTSIDYNRAVPITQQVHWIGSLETHNNLRCHPYFIENGDTSILIDPGSPITLNELLDKLRSIMSLDHIKYIILHHQDPGFSVLGKLTKLINREDLTVVTHSYTVPFLAHYGVTPPRTLCR